MGNCYNFYKDKRYQVIQQKVEEKVPKINRKDGVFYFDNGNTWTGKFDANGKPTGHGTLTFKCGDKYEGQMEDGKCSGLGLYCWSDNEEYYGEFKNHKMHGFGICTTNHSTHDGQWVNGIKDGFGTTIVFNPTTKKLIYKYEGQWKNNYKDGEGIETIYRDDDTNEVCRGTWKNNKKHGFCRTELIKDKDKMLFVEGIYNNGYLVSR